MATILRRLLNLGWSVTKVKKKNFIRHESLFSVSNRIPLHVLDCQVYVTNASSSGIRKEKIQGGTIKAEQPLAPSIEVRFCLITFCFAAKESNAH